MHRETGKMPTKKSGAIEDLLTAMTGRDRRESIQSNICTWCGSSATQFKSKLSEKEYTISGMCQECQDRAFSEKGSDDDNW